MIAWEPVKIFQAYMEYSIARNKLQHKVGADLGVLALLTPLRDSCSCDCNCDPQGPSRQVD